MSNLLVFENQGRLSVLDLISMGDSSKKDDDSKIGKFDSGLKYALSILYSNSVNFRIETNNKTFTVDSKILTDPDTTKTKEVLVIIETPDYVFDESHCENCPGTEHGSPNSLSYQCEGRFCDEMKEAWLDENIIEHVTGFSTKLGSEWTFWFSLREIYSNCLDEGGYMYVTDKLSGMTTGTTRFIIEIDPKIQEVLNNWDNFFLKPNLIDSYRDLGIHTNNVSNHLKIYKHGILVYEDENTESLFSYNHLSIKIDEMRCASLDNRFEDYMRSLIIKTENIDVINLLCESDNKYYETSIDYDYGIKFSDAWVDIVNQRFANKTLRLGSNLLKPMFSDERFVLDTIRVKRPDSPYSFDRVNVEKVIKDEVECDLSFDKKILKIASEFKFEVKYPIVESNIANFKVLGDTRSKTLYITNSFTSDDMWELIRACYNIENKDLTFIYKEYTKLLKK